MRIITESEKLPEFPMPIKDQGRGVLDLRPFLAEKQREKNQGFLQQPFKVITQIPGALETRAARTLLKQLKAHIGSFDFDENFYKTDACHAAVNTIKRYYAEGLARLLRRVEKGSVLPETKAKWKLEVLMNRSKALLNAVDDLYSNPRYQRDLIDLNLRKLFIYADNLAKHEIINAKRFLADEDRHRSLSAFERITSQTPHYNLQAPQDYEASLQAFMPAIVKDIDWRSSMLQFLGTLFGPGLEDSLQYLALFNEPDLALEGFTRNHFRKPYVNVANAVIDQAVYPELNDPEMKMIPASTAVHEIVHVLLMDRYPEYFTHKKSELKRPEDLETKFTLKVGKDAYHFPITHIEELICFALTIYINPITTVRKLASIKKNQVDLDDNYSVAAIFGAYLKDRYNLAGTSERQNKEVSTSIKGEALEMATHYIKLLDQMVAQERNG